MGVIPWLLPRIQAKSGYYLYKYLSLNKRTVLSYLVCRLELLDGCCIAIFASVLPDASAIF